jgi:tRNA (guanine37-N1)-methyltransferase
VGDLAVVGLVAAAAQVQAAWVDDEERAELDERVAVQTTRLGPNDAGEVLTLQLAAWVREAHDNHTLAIPALHETLEVVRAGLGDPQLHTWGHRARSGRLLGMVRTSLLDPGTALLGRLGVVPDLVGHGLGSALLRLAEARLDPGVHRVQLLTGAGGSANQRFYQRHGYRAFDDPSAPPGTVSYEKALAR